MSDRRLYSVEEVAGLLGLHVRTVRTYVRQGRLRAVRIGKQYRVAEEDLAELTGRGPAREAPSAGSADADAVHCDASTVVHAEPLTREQADRLRTTLLAGVAGPEGGRDLVRVECVHDERRRRTTVVIVGGAAATADVLRAIDALVEAMT